VNERQEGERPKPCGNGHEDERASQMGLVEDLGVPRVSATRR
jgi:hypothetical protein